MAEYENDEDNEKKCGIVLGVWDQEKTTTLIKDLESSVNLIETKCKKLLQQLLVYKKYIKKLSNDDVKILCTFKGKNWRNQKCHRLASGSDPDISFRKNLCKLQEFEEKFEANFEEELLALDNILKNSALKIGLKNNIFLSSTDSLSKTANEDASDSSEESWPDLCEKFMRMSCGKGSSKSEPIIAEALGNLNRGFSKITKRELELYKKLSRLSFRNRKKIKVLNVLKARNPKINIKSNSKFKLLTENSGMKLLENGCKKKQKQTKRMRFFKAKNFKCFKRRMTVQQKKLGYNRFCSKINVMQNIEKAAFIKKLENKEHEIEKICQSLVNAFDENYALKNKKPFCENLSKSYFTRQTNSYAACSSVRKSAGGQRFTSTSASKSTCCSVSAIAENNNNSSWPRRPAEKTDGKFWPLEPNKTTAYKKLRFKYTTSSPESYLEYHKSTTEHFTTDAHKSFIKSESKNAFAVASKIIMSDCRTTDFYHCCANPCNESNVEWNHISNTFNTVYRKYIGVKEKITNSSNIPSQAVIDSLGNEINCALKKYQNFLQFYSKFLLLEDRLKSLNMSCGTKAKSFSHVTPKNVELRKSTNSMAMKKIYQRIQDLQEEIKMK